MAGRAPLLVIDIVVPESELVRRLGSRLICAHCGQNGDAADEKAVTSMRCRRCGGPLQQRADDNEAVVRERLKVYQLNTAPLVKYYQGRPTFRAVDGTLMPDVVAAALSDAVESAKSVGVGGTAL